MKYPTLDEVEMADRVQLCKWYRFLPLPFSIKYPKVKGKKLTDEEYLLRIKDAHKMSLVLDRIVERWKEAGGFSPEISKLIGWDKEVLHEPEIEEAVDTPTGEG